MCDEHGLCWYNLSTLSRDQGRKKDSVLAPKPHSKTCWFSWAGHPLRLVCDRGLYNRGVLQQYMSENGIQVHHAPLEAPEQIGRVERHGGVSAGHV